MSDRHIKVEDTFSASHSFYLDFQTQIHFDFQAVWQSSPLKNLYVDVFNENGNTCTLL